MEQESGWKGENRRVSRQGLDQLEIEIHAEKVRVWVDGASQFLADDKNRAALEAMIERILDGWFKTRTKTVLAAFGLTALGSMLVAGLIWLGWRGWGGGK